MRPLLTENWQIETLRSVLLDIVKHPETWEQDTWATLRIGSETSPPLGCGTTGCVASHLAVRAGHKIDWLTNWNGTLVSDYTKLGCRIDEAAMAALGVSPVQWDTWHEDAYEEGMSDEHEHTASTDLFYGGHGLRDLFVVAGWLTGGAITVPPEYDTKIFPDGS